VREGSLKEKSAARAAPFKAVRHVEEEIQSLMQSYKLKQKVKEILPFVMTLERTSLRQMRKALDSIRDRDYIVIDPVWFPIWSAK